MALISCDECGHDVSTRALSCPNCGAPPIQPNVVSELPVTNQGAAAVARERQIPPLFASKKTGVMTYVARAYFIGGVALALIIGPAIGAAKLGGFIAYWLLIGLGVAIIAVGYSRENRDWIKWTMLAIGWIYTVLVFFGILSAL